MERLRRGPVQTSAGAAESDADSPGRRFQHHDARPVEPAGCSHGLVGLVRLEGSPPARPRACVGPTGAATRMSYVVGGDGFRLRLGLEPHHATSFSAKYDDADPVTFPMGSADGDATERLLGMLADDLSR